MKKLSIVFFALVANLNLVLGQTQFFANGAVQPFDLKDGSYQIGVPVDIPLHPKFAFTTGLVYAANKESDTYDPTIIRTEFNGSTSGLFSTGIYVTETFNSKVYRQNFLSVPLAIKFQSNADNARSAFIAEAGFTAVCAVNGLVRNREVSRTYKNAEGNSNSKPNTTTLQQVAFKPMNIKDEGMKRLNLEYRLGLGLKLPKNFQLMLRWEGSLFSQYQNANGYNQLKNQHGYLSLNVPIYKMKGKS